LLSVIRSLSHGEEKQCLDETHLHHCLSGSYLSLLVSVALWNLTFLLRGGKNMVLFPQPSLRNLNGFLVSFIVAGVVFFVVSLVTQPGTTEKKSLALFFHPSLDE